MYNIWVIPKVWAGAGFICTCRY